MPKLKDYPKWFSPYCEPSLPHKPVAPKKTIEILSDSHKQITEGKYSYQELIEIITSCKADIVVVKSGYDYCSTYACVELYCVDKQDNPYYDDHNKDYEKELTHYKKELPIARQRRKQWKQLKAKWDAEIKKEEEVAERKLWKKLNKKFDSTTTTKADR